jgi:hypothetical protein
MITKIILATSTLLVLRHNPEDNAAYLERLGF